MTTTRTLPAQAQVTSPNGWTVTVTHAERVTHVFAPYHAWCTTISNPIGLVKYYGLGLSTPDAPDPDPMLALERVAGWLPVMLADQFAARELSDAIAGMYGEPVGE